MRPAARRTSVVAAVAVVTLTGCGVAGDDGDDGAQAAGTPSAGASRVGGSPSEPTDSSGSPSASAEPTATGSRDDSGGSPVETEDDALEVEVEIEDGQVTPSGERVDVEVGQLVRFRVDSDVADEIHVHSTPEHTFRFSAGADDREFEFRLNQPGVVEAELHELGDIVVTLAARP